MDEPLFATLRSATRGRSAPKSRFHPGGSKREERGRGGAERRCLCEPHTHTSGVEYMHIHISHFKNIFPLPDTARRLHETARRHRRLSVSWRRAPDRAPHCASQRAALRLGCELLFSAQQCEGGWVPSLSLLTARALSLSLSTTPRIIVRLPGLSIARGLDRCAVASRSPREPQCEERAKQCEGASSQLKVKSGRNPLFRPLPYSFPSHSTKM